MIPGKVEVEGFLCYREKQAVDLDGSDLWVFTGRNGSGKSTIFDAITFALFGVHRGGARRLEELINAGASEFRVAFEFDLGPDRFRIARSLRRGGRSDRQVYRREVDAGGEEHWLPVAETDRQDGLDRWVAQNVGLNDEMFTCSMMLRQGQAEKLLEAKPAERFKIVAEVADLKSYQLLHGKAEARCKERKGRLDGLRAVLARKPVVEPAAVQEAEARLAGAEEARAGAAAERDRLAGIEGRARLWLELVGSRGKALEAAGRARRVIEDSATIAADWGRLQELDGVVPVLLRESARKAEIAGRAAVVAERRARRELLVLKLGSYEDLAEQARGRLAEVGGEIARDEARRAAIRDRLVELAAPIQRARAATAQRRAVAAREAALAAFPDDLEAEAVRLAAEAARRVGWKAALPTLENLAAAREGLAGARSRIGAGIEAAAVAEAEARRAGEALEIDRAEAARARLAREQADRRRVEARTIFHAAQGRLDSFEGLEGSPACDRCGQALTPEHFAAEARRLRSDFDAALWDSEEAERSSHEAEARAESSEAAAGQADRTTRQADTALADARRGLAQAEADAARHEAACAGAYGQLDEPFRSAVATGPVADGTATTFPAPDDLDEGYRLREGLPEAERVAREAREQLDAMRGERSRLEEARRALDSLGLSPGDEGAEAEHARLVEEAASLDRCLNAHRLEKASAEEAIDDLAAKREEVGAETVAIDQGQASDGAAIEASREASARDRASVPGPWLPAFDGASRGEVEGWEAERRSLRDRGVAELAEEVPKARWALDAAETQIADLDARLAEIPEEARRDPAEVADLKDRADARLAMTEEEARASQRELDALRRDRDERTDLEARALETDRSLAVAAKLAELLGRGGLQRALIRDAERGILGCANPILRDISGDDLELRLTGEDPGDEQALPLEVVDRTHGPGRTLGVAFLSGSQRFRVAVSLALGIGQYARGLNRPIQSVIIDEGFGCLDRQGRDEMIAQLTALKGRLARVVLVSHQEEFAEAFTDGYRFEVRDGSTEVREFHR